MDKKLITRKAVSQVLRDYWRQYKKFPLQSIIALLFPAIGTVLVSFVPPLIFGRMINIFITQHAITLVSVRWHIILLGSLWLLGEAFWRIGYHYLVKIETKGEYTFGMSVAERRVGALKNPNTKVAIKIDGQKFIEDFVGFIVELNKKA